VPLSREPRVRESYSAAVEIANVAQVVMVPFTETAVAEPAGSESARRARERW
jgi:hypothetical protein